jgi:tetratricopeptide (TPR) repeat protein
MSEYKVNGIRFLKSVENEKAVEAFKKALKENPDDIEVLRHIGLAFFNIGDYSKALKHWKRCVQLDPKHHQTWWNLGQLNEILNDYEEAFRNYNQAATTAYDSPGKAKRYKEWAKRVSKKI